MNNCQKKRPLCLLLIIFLLFTAIPLTGCGKHEKTDGKTVVCSIFPIYDWTKILLSGVSDVRVKLLVDNGADLHSYQATADDIIDVVACGLLIYVGGESDTWISDAAKNHERSADSTMELLPLLGDKALKEELLPGMQEEESDSPLSENEEEEEETDEHVWLSVRNAELFVAAIEAKLCELYPDDAAQIHENAAAYQNELSALDAEFTEALSENAPTLVIADRFPFVYLMKDYGITCYAAFSGCSAESEASFETISFLADKIDSLGLSSVYVLDGSDGTLAETVTETAKTKGLTIRTLESMQSVTLEQAEAGTAYLELMKKNLKAIKESLN